jgi:LuxR family maltose regulon positive regulatory protein
MDAPLLTSKLYIPRVRASLVARPRLLEHLDEGLREGSRLILISAPAGFGKTTLVSEWHSSPAGRPYPLAWLSLDCDDNAPVRFLTYFIAALDSLHADVGREALTLIQSSPPAPSKAVLVTLINSLASLPTEFVLVLDDYHVIEARSIHQMLAFVLERMPPQMHLVIASRSDPPLPLAGLRARGQMVELRAADLAFTPDEETVFLNQVMALNLTPEQIVALDVSTEGWIAGLQLAALSLHGCSNVPDFIADFHGSQRFILDYLAEQVLQHQPRREQLFLLQTSVLDRMTGSLCDAVLQSDVPSQDILERLDCANLFVVPLDEHREWYRYHHLFGEFLRARLQRSQPELLCTLHSRASEWLEQNGLTTEAVDHALAARDFERAARLIEQIGRTALMRSDMAKPLAWLRALPDELLRSRPRLRLLQAWCALLGRFQVDTAEAHLREAERGLTADAPGPTSERANIAGEVIALRGLVAVFRGDVQRVAELAEQALDQLPEDDLFLRSIVTFSHGTQHVLDGDAGAAISAYGEAAEIARREGNILIAVASMCQVAEQQMLQGRLHQAAETYRQALQWAIDRGAQWLPVAGIAQVGIGELLREWNHLDEATRHLTQGMELCAQWDESLAMDGLINLARVKQAQGDHRGALDAILGVKSLTQGAELGSMLDLVVGVHQARLWVAQGDLEAAARWAQERSRSTDDEDSTDAYPDSLRDLESRALARVRIALGDPSTALKALDRRLPAAERLGKTGVVIEILALRALALQAQGDAAPALGVLKRALSLAEPEGYIRLFADLGEPMAVLLSRVRADLELDREAPRGGRTPSPPAISLDYVDRLLAALEGGEAARAQAPQLARSPAPSLVEPLTERELEVLAMMAAGKSNPEIAGGLVIAISTVRSHVKSIYGKLGASSRVQAVLRARELGLAR